MTFSQDTKEQLILVGAGLIVSFIMVVLIIPDTQATAQVSRNDTFYMNTALMIATAHNWTYPNYVCRDFAWDLAQSLVKEGYIVKIKNGRWLNVNGTTCSKDNYKRFKCKHMWVLVKINNKWIPIESTTGEIIPMDIYKRNYK